MTFSAFIARWFGLTFSGAGSDPGTFVLPNEHYHYEEEDQYRLDGDGDSDDSPSDYAENEPGYEAGDCFRPSRLFASYYEEEADHRGDTELLDGDELIPEA